MKIKERYKKHILFILLFLIPFLFFSFIFNFVLMGDRMTGESMLPELKHWDMVYSIRTNEIQVGDIIIFENSKGADVIHRVIEIKDDRYVTKGDNNQWSDWNEIVTQENIKGKMIFRIPFGKLFKN